MATLGNGDGELPQLRELDAILAAEESGGTMGTGEAAELGLYALLVHDGTNRGTARVLRAHLLAAAAYAAAGPTQNVGRAIQLCDQARLWQQPNPPLGYIGLGAYADYNRALLMLVSGVQEYTVINGLAATAAQHFETTNNLRAAALARLVAAVASTHMVIAPGPQRWHHLREVIGYLLETPRLYEYAQWLINSNEGEPPTQGLTVEDFLVYQAPVNT